MVQSHLKVLIGGVDSCEDWQQTNEETSDPAEADVEQCSGLGDLGLAKKNIILVRYLLI